ncbi:MAG: methyltransferase [Alphaproteobacteria bacterium]|nr:methyltransferase [Alphaproteobacteria bacterium]
MASRIFFAASMSALLLAAAAHAQSSPDYAAIVAAPDRSAADRKIDANRAPAQWLAFLGIKPGMTVLDVFDVNGYKSELMARAGAKVYAQNSERAYARVKDLLEPRLKTPAGANIVSIVRPIDDPAPPGVQLDLVTFFFAYHDITYLGVDRPKMLKAIYAALKPGAYFIMGDWSAKPGAGTSVVRTLHRSDEALVRSEIEAAGFRLVGEGDFLRHPEDKRDTHSHMANHVDAYVLKFQKPD